MSLDLRKPPDFEKLEGWCSPFDAGLLYALAFQADAGEFVEVGAWLGRSFVLLADAASRRSGCHATAVDTWEGSCEQIHQQQIQAVGGSDSLHKAFLSNMEPYTQWDAIRSKSVDAARHWSGPAVTLLHIDGGHEPGDALADFLAWAPRLAPRAIVVFDDVPDWEGPTADASLLHSSGVLTHITQGANKAAFRIGSRK